MKVIRHAGVDSRMIILDDQACQQMVRHFPIVTLMQHFAHHELRQAYSTEKVATYTLVQWAMIGQDSMHVQHNIRPVRWKKMSGTQCHAQVTNQMSYTIYSSVDA